MMKAEGASETSDFKPIVTLLTVRDDFSELPASSFYYEECPVILCHYFNVLFLRPFPVRNLF